MRPTDARPGLGGGEVVILVVVVGLISLCLLIAMPRGREASREATCKKNLGQVGQALILHQINIGRLPGAALGGPGPVASMLDELGVASFAGLDAKKGLEKKSAPGVPSTARVIPSLLCPSDFSARTSGHPAPISYRANTGDTADGQHGPFAIGRKVSLEEVEAADGTSYTAAFAERMVGRGGNPTGVPSEYHAVPGPISGPACPTADAASGRTDAGSSWLRADWRSTLYSHVLPPSAETTCVAQDGRTAALGASSAHPGGFHVLLLDGSVRPYSRSIAPALWSALGTIGEPPP